MKDTIEDKSNFMLNALIAPFIPIIKFYSKTGNSRKYPECHVQTKLSPMTTDHEGVLKKVKVQLKLSKYKRDIFEFFGLY